MLLNNPTRDGEAQAHAARRAGAPLIHAIKTIEDAALVFRRNAGAAVAHFDEHLRVGNAQLNINAPSVRRIGDGVGDQVDDGLTQQAAINACENGGGRMAGEALIFFQACGVLSACRLSATWLK